MHERGRKEDERHNSTQSSTAQHSTAHNRILHKRTGKMKTTIVGIAVAAAAVTTVNGLKCEKRERDRTVGVMGNAPGRRRWTEAELRDEGREA